jgi:hypothetical protein
VLGANRYLRFMQTSEARVQHLHRIRASQQVFSQQTLIFHGGIDRITKLRRIQAIFFWVQSFLARYGRNKASAE